jgi:hypothetical protein
VSGKRVTEFEKRDGVTSRGMDQGEEIAMAQSSPQRRRYLAARRRGLSQSEAMKEAGVSRSTAWRHDKLFHQEEAERAALRDRVKASRATRESDDDEALREAAVKDVAIEGPATYPVPPWGDSQDGTRVAPSAQEPLVADGSFPAGLLERRQRARDSQGASQGAAPLPNRRGVVVMRGPMPGSEDMGGRLSRPFLPEDPPNLLGGAI